MRTLVWLRGKDLRLSDHAPLSDAIADGDVVPLFVLDPYFFAAERARNLPHRIQFLLDALRELEARIAEKGSRLVVVRGRAIDVVPKLAKRWRVDRVSAYRWVEPFARERDRRVAEALQVPMKLYEGETLLPPGSLRTGAGQPYAVFTPFSRAFHARFASRAPRPAPRSLPPLPDDVRTPSADIPSLESLALARNAELIPGGERAARKRLRAFIHGAAETYQTDRDRMDRKGTSRLSADLKFGTISVMTVWHEVARAVGDTDFGQSFLNQLIWRDFAHSSLWDRPELLERPYRPDFARFPWRSDAQRMKAWTTGQTGYPIVDAAARQLLGEGFVHNRARMIAASFLTKHLMIHYRDGEAHYLRYLVDGDWAQNNMGWQWSAGCGCDAQPYFRVFNPMTQGKKFDPAGEYVKRWVPELSRLPEKYVHAPWTAPASVLDGAGVRLGVDYPHPIVDHREARTRFLEVAGGFLGKAPSADAGQQTVAL